MNVARTAVVTGANRGIGLAVARELLAAGGSVVLVVRSREAGEAAARELGALGDVRAVVGDLSSVRTTRAAAERITSACSRIDVLVHNAGIWPSRLERNEDGLERAFAVNHLAPFVLNMLLGPSLSYGSRVVQVSAGLYAAGRVDLERTPTGDDFHAVRTYATTKLCNLLLLPMFAERFRSTGVTINALHPGVIRTGLGDREGFLGVVLKGVKRLWKTPRAGALPVVRLALAPELAKTSGRFFDREREVPLREVACDREKAERLWELSLRLGGVDDRSDLARRAVS
jgi:NAD(P)-dependent dehydrogenase (short-subunit alcohol dehydrogenase family)